MKTTILTFYVPKGQTSNAEEKNSITAKERSHFVNEI